MAAEQTVTIFFFVFLNTLIPRFLAGLHFAVLQILGVAPRMKIIKNTLNQNILEVSSCFV